MNFTVVIGISFVIVVGAVGGYVIVGNLVNLATQPVVTMTWDGASVGVCTPTYFGPFQTGATRAVLVNFTLRNTGASNGQVTVTFTQDGTGIKDQNFLIGAGQTEAFSAHLQISDCDSHQYWGYPSNVQRA